MRGWSNFHHLISGHTSLRIWVAFLALKSSGVSSSTVSPLPFTPSSRSLLYSFYRMEKEQRDCREGHTGRPGQGIQTVSTMSELKVTRPPKNSLQWETQSLDPLNHKNSMTGCSYKRWLDNQLCFHWGSADIDDFDKNPDRTYFIKQSMKTKITFQSACSFTLTTNEIHSNDVFSRQCYFKSSHGKTENCMLSHVESCW